MNIAVLAWGSLVWNRGGLEIADDFQPNGPILPIEFARVSKDGRLTLVIDYGVGTPCLTHAAKSSFTDLDSALQNLWLREGPAGDTLPRDVRKHGRVGYVDVIRTASSDVALKRHPKAVDAIAGWAKKNAFDGVVWTTLASNFHDPDKAGQPFSVEAAIKYLEHLDADTLALALGYIRQAPSPVMTVLRAAVAERWPEGQAG